MKREANYQELDTVPFWTRPQWVGVDNDRIIINDSDPYKWSGDNPPPAVGTRVRVYLNKLGYGTVVGYFAEYGWLGVRVQLEKNPAWRRKQLDGKNPPAHLFGLDLEPRQKVSV